jgi:excisionase family DNA binding protein
MLTYTEVAKVLGTTPRHVRRLTRECGLPFVRIGRLVRIDPADLAAWVEANRYGDLP